jgi:hypothetical protein
MGQLLGKLGLVRRGHTFYALRHTLETIGGESRDQVAVDAIMGHSRDDMASVYRERIGDDRLRAVVQHVRNRQRIAGGQTAMAACWARRDGMRTNKGGLLPSRSVASKEASKRQPPVPLPSGLADADAG